MKIKTDQAIIANRWQITQKITNFWNQTSLGWRAIWGPHIHHGYYEENDALGNPLIAQEKLILKLMELLELPAKHKVLDVGCGMGGSSLFLAKKYNLEVTGITLSAKQVTIAKEQARLENINSVDFKIEDALALQSFADNSFDLVWSLESCEQFFDKQLFLNHAYRVLKPGGKLLLATWCSDQEEYENQQAKQYQKLCLAFDLPYMPTINRYKYFLETQCFHVHQVLDWTNYVKSSWNIGIGLLKNYSFYQVFKLAGWRGLKMLYQIKLMRDAYLNGRINYGVFVGSKPFLT